MTDVAARLTNVRSRIERACAAAARRTDSVGLIAVSKRVAVERLREAVAAGQGDFGESYVQEALPKMAQLAGLGLTWHFIGPVQSNKTRDLAEHFDWVHGVDRLRLAERLSAQRPPMLGPLQVCVQVNISGEDSKSGCAPQDAPLLCAAVAQLPGLRLRGLMAIPALRADGLSQAPFRALRELFETIRRTIPQMDTLSAGMSDDLEAAIAEGATRVRIGSAIFGARG